MSKNGQPTCTRGGSEIRNHPGSRQTTSTTTSTTGSKLPPTPNSK